MAFADNLPKKLREKIPTLENFAVVSSAELWEMGQSMLALTEQIAAEEAAGDGEDAGDADD